MKNKLKFESLNLLYEKTHFYEMIINNLKITTFYLEQYCINGGEENLEKARRFASQVEINKRKLEGLDKKK